MDEKEQKDQLCEKIESTETSDYRQEDCSICLESIKNRAFTDSCFHSFCFRCLVEWSSVKSICPLCKQEFAVILHDVKSDTDYKRHVVSRDQSRVLPSGDGRFRYRTTNTREMQAFQQTRQRDMQSMYGRIQQFFVNIRQDVYRLNRWVRPNTGRTTVSNNFTRILPGEPRLCSPLSAMVES